MQVRNWWQFVALSSALVIAACSDQPTGVATAERSSTRLPSFNVVGQPAFVMLKKHGPEGDYQFQLTATTGSLPSGNPMTASPGDWTPVWTATSAAEPVAPLTITEILGPGMQVDSIWVLTLVRGEDGFLQEGVQGKLTGTNAVTLPVGVDNGAYVQFYNSVSPPTGGGEGCTPGYWKQSQHFGSWTAPYTPNTLFDDVFANAFPGQTLLQVLSLGGGGLDALGRHTVAALLNSASADVSSGLSPAGVISAFDAAYASGDYETQKNIFEGLNEQGCPLGLDEF
jgi:hypothetical protein